MDLQQIHRDMLWRKGPRHLEIFSPIIWSLAWQSCFKIEIDVFSAAASTELAGAQRTFNPMASSNPLQQIVLKRLHSNADTVHTGFER